MNEDELIKKIKQFLKKDNAYLLPVDREVPNEHIISGIALEQLKKWARENEGISVDFAVGDRVTIFEFASRMCDIARHELIEGRFYSA